MDKITRVFVDTSKNFFQLHGVDEAERPVLRRKLSRSQFLRFFAGLEPTVVGLEACGAAHHWARELRRLGHEAKLVPPQYVKAYLKRGKNDGRDAEAGCEAMSRPTMRFVAVKSAEDQAALMLASVRDRLTRQRARLANTIRGHAAEFGLVAAKGTEKIASLLASIADDAELPELARELFARLGCEWERLCAELKVLAQRLVTWHRANPVSVRLAGIPGIGPVTASMLVMKAPDPAAFRSGRDFSAWLGLTPKDHSTAGKQRLGGITRAGDEDLRSLLVVGATAVLQHARRGRCPVSPWLIKLIAKDKPKLAAVALANKLARIAWKMMVSGEAYDPARLLSPLPATA